jgi:hypothetical protein
MARVPGKKTTSPAGLKPRTFEFKGRTPFSNSQLALFVIAFAAVGFFLVKTMAATTQIASLEAEQMSLSGGSAYSDGSASGGQAITFSSNGSASGSVSLPGSASSISLLAKGASCSNNSVVYLAVDNVTVSSFRLAAGGWTAYSVAKKLPAGLHKVNLTVSNGYGFGRGHCSSYFDVFRFFGITTVVNPPTLSFSVQPGSVAAGQSATLTWNSTNATACSASGAWAGSQLTHGSVSTGALNQTTTYNLTCSGEGGATTAAVTVQVSPPPVNCSGTLQSKINAAANSASLNLTGCKYSENITINKNLSVTGPTITGAVNIDGRGAGQIIKVTLSNVTVSNPAGYGVSVWSAALNLKDSTVQNCLRGGIRDYETSTNSVYDHLKVLNNGHDKDANTKYNGDGILVQGQGTVIKNSTLDKNGEDTNYEHGIYVGDTARNISITDNTITNSSASGIKMGGTGEVRRNKISGGRIGIVIDGTEAGAATLANNDITVTYTSLLETSTSTIARFSSDYNTFHTNAFLKQNVGVVTLSQWQQITRLDLHSSLAP